MEGKSFFFRNISAAARQGGENPKPEVKKVLQEKVVETADMNKYQATNFVVSLPGLKLDKVDVWYLIHNY